MKNETLQQLLKRTVGENLLKVTFVKPEGNDTLYTKDGLLKMMNTDNQIKVQSVALPLNHQLFSLKTEEQFLDWMQNKIHNVHSAFFDFNNKYKENAEQVSWNNNKMQNQRYLETSGR
jgi:hypothetical protein